MRLEEATKRKRSSVTVDFVIDVSELKNGATPVQLYYGDNWYKYTSPDDAFSVLMRGSFGPTESTYTTTIGNSYLEIKAVEAAYLLSERQIVNTFEIPSTVIDDVTLEQFLDSLDPTTRLTTDANAIIDAANRIQLDGIPGREWIFRVTTDDNPKPTQPIHVRIYVVGRTAYHLTFGGVLPDANETGERFLNSFTLHRSAP